MTERLAEELRLELQIALALKSEFTDDQMRIDCSTATMRSSGVNLEAFLFYLTFFSSQKSQQGCGTGGGAGIGARRILLYTVV